MKSFVAYLFLCASTLCVAQQPAAPAARITCSPAPAAPPSAADTALLGSRYAEAEALYSQQLSSAPTDAAYAGLIHSLILEDKWSQALDKANQAVTSFPASSIAHVLQGDANLRAAHTEEAFAAYKAAAKIDFCSARAHFGLARVLDLKSMHASAQKELITAHKLAAADSEISEALFSTLQPAMHASGLRNILASDHNLSAGRRQQLTEEAWQLETGSSCVVEMTPATAKVPFYAVPLPGNRIRDFDIRAEMNGKPISLELDSTAPGIVLTRSDADRLHLSFAPSVENPGYGIADSVAIGALHFVHCPVRVLADAQLANATSLIGTAFFRDFVIHIRWREPNILLSPLENHSDTVTDRVVPASETSWSPILINKGRVLLPVMADKKPVTPMLLDTAYPGVVLSPSLAAAYTPTPDPEANICGISGEFVRVFLRDTAARDKPNDLLDLFGHRLTYFRSAKNLDLTFAGYTTTSIGSSSFDISAESHALGFEVSGMVGFPVLRHYDLDLDYRNGLVHFNYDIHSVIAPTDKLEN